MHLVAKRELVNGMTERAPGGLLERTIRAVVGLAGGEWSGSRRPSKRQMEVLETLTLGPKKQLLLVRCNEERYLVGTGAESVQTMVRIYPNAAASREAAVRGEWI